MTDESNTEIAETALPTEAAPPKKRGGPRPKNVVSDASAETPEVGAAHAMKRRRKRADKSTDASTAASGVAKTRAKNVVKGPGKTREVKQTAKAPAATPVLEDTADLLQLEEENARLRKSLAEKLRAENADLRKRLGLA
ncbi:hypothetical protein N182_27830 [Sinorhizobium sp. GL2]|nr:hypothetical protein N182_27830 [Sinorhizobium sp. GL2]